MSRSSKRRNLGNKSKRRSTKLRGQRLERRELMAADIGMVDSHISIQGSEQNDVAEIYLVGDFVEVSLTSYNAAGELVSSQKESFSPDVVDRIIFQAGDGDDLFINDTAIDSITRSGGGSDTVMGGEGNDILAAGIGDDIVLGGGGNDTILAGPGENIVIPSLESDESPSDDAQGESTPEEPLEEPAEEASAEDSVVDESHAEYDAEPVTPVMDEPAISEPLDPVDEVMTDVSTDSTDSTEESTEESAAADVENDPTTDEVAEVDEPEETNVNTEPPVDSHEPHGQCALDESTDEVETADGEIVNESPADTDSEIVDVGGATSEPTEPESTDMESVDSGTSDDSNGDVAADQPELVPIGESTELADLQTTTPAGDEVPLDMQDDTIAPNVPQSVNEDSAEPDLEEEEVELELTQPDMVEDTLNETTPPAENLDVQETDNDVIFGGEGDDLLFGESGDDLVFGGDSPLDEETLMDVIRGMLSR